jgi:hypothetical protein
VFLWVGLGFVGVALGAETGFVMKCCTITHHKLWFVDGELWFPAPHIGDGLVEGFALVAGEDLFGLEGGEGV